ncbi:MAG TPA: hypothetical protein VMZ31_06875 [Phycisphaerae bacterium]|nr:hypothetical protein [Phycisphaerae bacterium]
MKRLMTTTITLLMGPLGMTTVFGSEAATQASVTNGRSGNGSAMATAEYEGVVGLARTRTETGNVTLARGLAVGFDEDGLSVSLSHGVASRRGPAYAGTFNLAINTNGQVSGSYGGVLSRGGSSRSAMAGGSVYAAPRSGSASAFATGQTRGGGTVKASTQSYQRRVQVARRVLRTVKVIRRRR